jgi:hypothetical protein
VGAIEYGIPLWLVFWAALSVYSVVWELCVMNIFLAQSGNVVMANPGTDAAVRPTVISGIVIVALSGVFKLQWIGSWFWAGVMRARFRRMSPLSKNIMQAGEASMESMLAGRPVNHRFRTCGRCESKLALGDREYHCSADGHHYPVYDHHCSWLRVPVFLHTIKPYALHLVFLVMDALLVLALSTYGLVTAANTRIHAAAVVASVVILLWLALGSSLERLYWLVVRNTLGAELSLKKLDDVRRHVLMAQKTEFNRVDFVEIPISRDRRGLTSPWELTTWMNLREVLGPVWAWPLFFVAPRRVSDYGSGYDRNTDYPLGFLWRDYDQNRFERPPTSVVFNPVVQIETDQDVTPVPARKMRRRREAWSSSIEMV